MAWTTQDMFTLIGSPNTNSLADILHVHFQLV